MNYLPLFARDNMSERDLCSGIANALRYSQINLQPGYFAGSTASTAHAAHKSMWHVCDVEFMKLKYSIRPTIYVGVSPIRILEPLIA